MVLESIFSLRFERERPALSGFLLNQFGDLKHKMHKNICDKEREVGGYQEPSWF